MRIRSPSPSDREKVIEIISRGETFRPDEVSCAIELLDGALGQSDGNTYQALILEEDGAGGAEGAAEPVAYACFGRTPMTEATFDLYWLVVGVAARGRGLGRQMLAAAEAEMRGQGGRTVRVETSTLEGKGGAVRFYDQVGYRRVGTIDGFYRPGDDLVIFAKAL